MELMLETTNIIAIAEKDIEDFINLISQKKYVEGVVLLGGLGKRRFLDKYSDLDIAIFYRAETTSNYFLPFEFHATLNKHRYEFNIHQLFYKTELKKDWNEEKKEAYARSKILVDKKKRIKKLIKIKTAYDKKSAYNRLIWIMEQYVWRGQIHSLRTLYRGYPDGAHDLLNECLELLIEAVYILNFKYRPHKKWRIAILNTVEILPNNFFRDIKQAMLISDFSIKDIKRRIKILNKIYAKIVKLVKQKYPNFPEQPYEYYYRNFIQLKKDCFIQKTLDQLRPKTNTKELRKLEEKLCLNLISNRRDIAKYN